MMLSLISIALFCSSLLGLYVYQTVHQDVYRVLAALIGFVCLILGLAIAHWIFNLLFLVFLLRFKLPIALLKPICISR